MIAHFRGGYTPIDSTLAAPSVRVLRQLAGRRQWTRVSDLYACLDVDSTSAEYAAISRAIKRSIGDGLIERAGSELRITEKGRCEIAARLAGVSP